MPNNLSVNLPEYGSYTKEQLVDKYGEGWENRVNDLNGSVSLEGYGEYSVSDLRNKYGDDWENRVDLINNPKKKEQEEQVQEDSESVSEDGSLESQEVTEEVDYSQVKKPEDYQFKTQNELELEAIEKQQSELVDISDEALLKIEEDRKAASKDQRLELEEAVSYVGANLTDDQLLSKSTQDLADELDTDIYSSDLNFALKGRKNDIINARTKEYSEEVKKSQIDSLLSEGLPQAEADSIYASTKKDDLLKSGIKVLGLDEEEVLKYSDFITEYYTLRNKGSERTDEENIKLVGLGEEIKNLREDMNAKEFINPETNNIDQEKAEESINLVLKYEKELKTDQQKFSERYSSERDKLKYLEKELLSMFDEGSGKDGITRSSVIEDIPSVLKGGGVLDNIYMRDEAEEAVNKYKSLYEEYEDTKSNFSALSRALLLNEDPASVSRGLGESDIPYLGAVMNVIGNVITAGGESLIEESTGFNVQTDSDFASKIVQIANEEGVKVTPEQAERAIPEFSEQLGSGIGASLPMMSDIIINTVIGNKIKGVLGVPKFFSKLEYLKKSPKITKLLDNTLEATQQALVFEFSEGGSAAMGVGEFLGEKGFEKAISKLGGKYGKVFKLLGKTLSAGVGGTFGEYGGDLAEQSFKHGLLTKASFRETFGRDYNEGLDKLILTGVISTIMGGGSQVGSFLSDSKAYYESIGDTQRVGDIQQLIDANKANDLAARVKSGEATIEELESVLGSGKDKPKKLDDMSKEELDAYAKENDIELEEIEKTLTPEETEEEVVPEEEIEEEEKPKTKDPEDNTLTLEEEVVEEPITEPDTISEEEIEESEEVESIPKEEAVEKITQKESLVVDSEESKENKEDIFTPSDLEELNPKAKLLVEKSINSLENTKKQLAESIRKKDTLSIKENTSRIGRLEVYLKKQKQNLIKKKKAEVKRIERQELKAKKEASRLEEERQIRESKSSTLSKVKSKWASEHSKETKGESFELETEGSDNIGLIEGYDSRTGSVIYGAYKNGNRTRVGISSYKGDLFTEGEVAKLKKLEQELRDQDLENSKKGSPFDLKESDVVSTPSVSEGNNILVKALKKAFGLDGVKILITTDSDLTNEVFEEYNLTGDYGKVRSAKLNSAEKQTRGVTSRIKEGEHYIYVDESLTPEQQAVVLSHEFGHILQKEKFNKLSETEQQLVKDEYNKWYASLTGKTLKEVREEVSDVSMWEIMNDTDSVFNPNQRFDRYLSSFSEWFADNVSKYVSSSEKPKSALDKFFYDIYSALKKIYTSFKKKNKKFPKFEEWLDSVFDPVKAEEVLEEYSVQKSKSGFSKTELQNKADTLADKSKKEYDKQKTQGKNSKQAAEETFRKVFKNASWFNKLSKVDQASVEADFNNRLVETFENPNPAKNQKGKPPKPKDTSDKVVTTVMKQLKEKWKNQDKGITEGKREALKTVKESQAEFQKDLNEVTKYLSESKRKRAELLLRKVKDQKSLEESRAALDALVSDKQVYVTAKESDINAELIRAEKKAEKNLTIEQRKRLKEITKDLKGRLKGKVNLRTAIQIANKLAGLDPFDISKVAEFESFVNNVVEDTEYTTKKSTAKSLQTKIKNKLKSLNKQAGKSKLGIRQVKATELAKLDINRIEDLEAFNEIAEKVLQSLSGKQVSFAEVSSQLDALVSETQKATKEFNEKLAKEQEAKIRAEYEASPMRDTMSFEKYQEIVEDIRQDELTAKAEAKLEESSDEMRSWVANRIDVIKSNLDVITSGMTPAQKAIIKTLIKAKDIISNKSIVGVKSLAKINQALDEIITYNSTSGVGIIDAELEALRASVNLARTLKGKLDPGNFLAKKGKGFMKIVSQKSNLTQFFKGITKGGEAMRNIAQKTVAKFESGFKNAKVLHKKFNTSLIALADALDIKEDQSIRIGIISRLEQNTQGLTEEESNLDLEEKITAIKNEIKTLKLSEYKPDKRMGAKLEKAFNSLKLEGIKTKKELKSKLTDNENKFLDFAKLEFSKIRESYQDTYRNSYGKELELEDNYLPTFARKKGESKKDIESNNYARTMDSDSQGRSIKRAKTDMTGATVYNYDIKRTASEGYYQTQYDINTLRDRQVLNSLMNSPVFKDLLMGRNAENVNGSHIELYEEFVNRMKTLAGKRKSSTSLIEAEKSKLKKVSSRIGNALIALPLKDVTQFIKQPAAIIINTLLRHPATTIQAFGDVSKMILSANIPGATQTEETKAIVSLLGEGNTKLRDTMGDLDFKNAESIIENLTNLTPKKMKRIINALGSGSLGEADMIATQGNWMANYRSFRRKQEGSGFKFDIIEEAKNPNSDAVTAANLAADEVNNVSDSTTKNQDETAVLNTLFFLFKSFSINQTIHTYLDIKNAFKSDSKSDKIEATKALTGSLTGIMAFVAVKQYVLDKGIDSIMDEFFGELDKEDEDEEKGVLSFLAEGLSELFMGGLPDDIMWAAKEGVNYISDKVSEDEVFKIYSSKVGVIGLGTSYVKDIADDIDILFGNNEYKEDGRTYEIDYSSSMKKAAVADLVGVLTQWGNTKRVGEKTKRAIKKREK